MPALIAIPLFTTLAWLWTCVLALPVWLLWSVCGLGTRYFGFLPAAWQSVSLPDAAGLFLLLAIGRSALSPVKFDFKA